MTTRTRPNIDERWDLANHATITGIYNDFATVWAYDAPEAGHDWPWETARRIVAAGGDFRTKQPGTRAMTTTTSEAARLIRAEAKARRESTKTAWAKHPGMVRMLRADAEDLESIAALTAAGLLAAAADSASTLETEVRESIPAAAWALLAAHDAN